MSNILRASIAELDDVEGIGEVRARYIKNGEEDAGAVVDGIYGVKPPHGGLIIYGIRTIRASPGQVKDSRVLAFCILENTSYYLY